VSTCRVCTCFYLFAGSNTGFCANEALTGTFKRTLKETRCLNCCNVMGEQPWNIEKQLKTNMMSYFVDLNWRKWYHYPYPPRDNGMTET